MARGTPGYRTFGQAPTVGRPFAPLGLAPPQWPFVRPTPYAAGAVVSLLIAGACVPTGRDTIGLDAVARAPRSPSGDTGVADGGHAEDAVVFVDAQPIIDADLPMDALPPDAGGPPEPPPPDAGFPQDAGPPPDPPPVTPLYRVAVRVHIGGSGLSRVGVEQVLEEINRIWWFAGLCFEFEAVPHERTQARGFDLWLVPEVPDPPGVNGVYRGDHDIWSRDRPSLRRVPGGTDILAGRTSAHELGHALRLPHRQDNTNLMASGTRGWTLNDTEIDRARRRAREVAESGAAPACAEIVFQ